MSHKILIVEDNDNNRSLSRDILTFHGYEVSVAADGQEGVVLARELMPDLILMDIQMPGMDGMTAAGILKGDPATSRLKIDTARTAPPRPIGSARPKSKTVPIAVPSTGP